MDVAARLEVVEAENEVIRARVKELEGLLLETLVPFPIEWGLTGHEAALLGFLANRAQASKDEIMTALYGLRVTDAEVPETKIVDVFVCKVRKKLQGTPVRIVTLWGRGYALDAMSRARFGKHRSLAA